MRSSANAPARPPTRSTAIVAALALAFGIGVTTTPASSQQAVSQQAKREQVVEILGSRYGETPVARGLTDSGAMVEVFAAADGETWTIVMTNPQGVSRIASTGVAWQDVRPPLGRLSSYAITD